MLCEDNPKVDEIQISWTAETSRGALRECASRYKRGQLSEWAIRAQEVSVKNGIAWSKRDSSQPREQSPEWRSSLRNGSNPFDGMNHRNMQRTARELNINPTNNPGSKQATRWTDIWKRTEATGQLMEDYSAPSAMREMHTRAMLRSQLSPAREADTKERNGSKRCVDSGKEEPLSPTAGNVSHSSHRGQGTSIWVSYALLVYTKGLWVSMPWKLWQPWLYSSRVRKNQDTQPAQMPTNGWILFIILFMFLRQDFTKYTWLAWNSLCSPG